MKKICYEFRIHHTEAQTVYGRSAFETLDTFEYQVFDQGV